MPQYILKTTIFASVLGLAGCSSGGADLVEVATIFGGAGTPITAAQTVEAQDANQAMRDAITAGDLAFARPTVATAQMSGMISVGDDTALTMGKMTLDADFTSNTLTGTTSEFALFSGAGASRTKVEDLTGALVVSNGAISGNSLSADMNGSLSGTSTTNYAGSITGGFLTTDAGNINALGGFSGTAQTGSTASQAFNDGTFHVSE